MFGGLGLQGHTDRYLVRYAFEGSFAEDETISGESIFEVGLKFAASEARKKFDSTASLDQGGTGKRSGSE